MKKIIISIIVVFFIIISFNIKNNDLLVMDYDENIDNIYVLNFTNEILSTNNFKLKIAPFTGYSYIIRKIYPKNNRDIQEYYTYDFRDLDEGINNFKTDYINNLRKNNLFDEVDKVYKSGVIISKIEIYTTKEAFDKFIEKYPRVEYEVISTNYESL